MKEKEQNPQNLIMIDSEELKRLKNLDERNKSRTALKFFVSLSSLAINIIAYIGIFYFTYTQANTVITDKTSLFLTHITLIILTVLSALGLVWLVEYWNYEIKDE